MVDAASLAPNGALRKAINGYYNPIPPRRRGTNIYSYRGGNGDPLVAQQLQPRATARNQYTNWDQSLDQAGDAGTTRDLVVYVTDGDPTAFDFDQAGDPFTPPDVGSAHRPESQLRRRSPSTVPSRRPTRSRPPHPDARVGVGPP